MEFHRQAPPKAQKERFNPSPKLAIDITGIDAKVQLFVKLDGFPADMRRKVGMAVDTGDFIAKLAKTNVG